MYIYLSDTQIYLTLKNLSIRDMNLEEEVFLPIDPPVDR